MMGTDMSTMATATPGEPNSDSRVPNITADGNGDGVVDLADYTVWRDNLGTGIPLAASITIAGDYNGNGTVDEPDFDVWRSSFGQVGFGLVADGNGDGRVDVADYAVWRDNLGATQPIPSLLLGSEGEGTAEPPSTAAESTESEPGDYAAFTRSATTSRFEHLVSTRPRPPRPAAVDAYFAEQQRALLLLNSTLKVATDYRVRSRNGSF